MKQLTINITDLVGYQYGYHHLLKQIEPVYFLELMSHTKGNKSQAAKIAGIHRATLCAKLKRYDITVEQSVKCLEVVK